jgi:hypothetical protein
MLEPTHLLNWNAGWILLLAGVLTGGFTSTVFHQPNYGGGYESFRRRIVRLGHVALAALGMVNLAFALSPWPYPDKHEADMAGLCFVLGGISMPGICFLTGWFAPMRHLFFIPVMLLLSGVVYVLKGAGP